MATRTHGWIVPIAVALFSVAGCAMPEPMPFADAGFFGDAKQGDPPDSLDGKDAGRDVAPPSPPPPDARGPDGWRPDGLSPDGLSPDGLSPDGLSPDGLSPDGLPHDGGELGGLKQDGLTLDGPKKKNKLDGKP